jgi:Ca-activated chloride channel family protein
MVGRYKNEGSTAVRLTGFINGKKKEFVYEDKFPERERENDFIPRIWATRKIGYLLSEIRFKGEEKELVDEVIELSKEYGVMTPYTSFLVLEPEEDRPFRRPMARATPVPRVRDSMHFMSKAFAPEAAKSGRAVGQEAVVRSQTIRGLKEAKSDKQPAREEVKHLGEKTFYLTNGFWIDSTFEEQMKITEIKYLSDEYFRLLKEKPDLGRYFSLAKNIIVVFEGECYKIVD